MKVVGFEGAWPSDSPVAWGAAILDDGELLINAASGQTAPRSELRQYLDSDAATSLPNAQALVDVELSGSVVLAIDRQYSYQHMFHHRGDPELGILKTAWSSSAYYMIFSDLTSFSSHADTVAARVFLGIGRNEVPADDTERLLMAALSLAQSNAYLLALKSALYSPVAARALLRHRCEPRTVDVFDDVVESLTTGDATYDVKYVSGIASRGGLDIEDATKQCRAFGVVQGGIANDFLSETDLPISRREMPDFHLRELQAASATFKFVAATTDDTALNRYLRYVQVKRLRRALAGYVPPSLQKDADFLASLRRVARPDDQTQVAHQAVGTSVFVPVSFTGPSRSDYAPAEVLTGLGYLEGVFERIARVEVAMHPSTTYKLSTRSDGEHRTPRGIETLFRGNDFLFRPALLEVRRYVAPQGATRGMLRGMDLLEDGFQGEISVVPSGVIPATFVNLSAEIRMRAKSLHLRWQESDDWLEIGSTRETEFGADSWLKRVQAAALTRELAVAVRDTTRWFTLGRQGRPSIEQVSIAVLRDADEPVTGGEWWRAVATRSNQSVPRQRLVRVTHQFADYVEQDDHRRWRLTAIGRAFGEVLKRGMGL